MHVCVCEKRSFIRWSNYKRIFNPVEWVTVDISTLFVKKVFVYNIIIHLKYKSFSEYHIGVHNDNGENEKDDSAKQN